MHAELSRCISVTQQILSELPISFINVTPRVDEPARDVIAAIVAMGIPRIEDSRVPDALNTKLHVIAESHSQKAVEALLHTHLHLDAASLRRAALNLKATYTSLYERKVLEVARMHRKSSAQLQKQPFANDILLYAFDRTPTPSKRERQMLASLTGMSLEQVRVWFQNRRSRVKKKAPELQSRPPLQLQEVLERVRAARTVIKRTSDTQEDNLDSDEDSGYCSDAASRRLLRRQPIHLTRIDPTPRSYPAAYVPQPLTSHSHFDPPMWRRAVASHPSNPTSTVTIDELTRSMARLSLRQRRPTCLASSMTVSADATSSQAMAAAQETTQNRRSRKPTPEARRKVAGGQRAASGTPSTTEPSPQVCPCGPVPKGRKKAGLPCRNPAGKVLSRQTSNTSVASTFSNSSSSSRSTSYASDSSFTSATSASSCTSVESTWATSDDHQSQAHAPVLQRYLDVADLTASYPHQLSFEQDDRVPVFDLSSVTFEPSPAGPAPGLDDMLREPGLLQLLEGIQPQQRIPSQPQLQLGSSDFSCDVDFANLDAFVDLSSVGFPTLDALLSGHHFQQANLAPQPQVLPVMSGILGF